MNLFILVNLKIICIYFLMVVVVKESGHGLYVINTSISTKI